MTFFYSRGTGLTTASHRLGETTEDGVLFVRQCQLVRGALYGFTKTHKHNP